MGGVFSGRARREQPRYNGVTGMSEFTLVVDALVLKEQIVKISIVNLASRTENFLTHRLINLSVLLPKILLISPVFFFKPIYQSLDNFRTGENSNLESCFLSLLLIVLGQFVLFLFGRIWGPG